MCAGGEGCGTDAGRGGECDGFGSWAGAEGGCGSGYGGVEAFVRGEHSVDFPGSAVDFKDSRGRAWRLGSSSDGFNGILLEQKLVDQLETNVELNIYSKDG